MQLIGLTGGIASGKSTVAARLARHGAVVIDADQLARAVVEPGSDVLEAIRLRFGDSVIMSNGLLDRRALGKIIFASATDRQALNEITHPAVSKRARELFDEAQAKNLHAIVVYEVPLLVEGSAQGANDFTLVVATRAGWKTRMDRLVRLRGMSSHEAAERLAAQATDAERAKVADVVIDTDRALDDTYEQVDELWERIIRR